MIVVVFDNELKAYEGTQALYQLDKEGSIAVHAESVIKKNTDGTVDVKKAEGDFPIRTVSGTAIGSLIGLLGGPLGLAVGATTGTVLGGVHDLYRAGVNTDFLDEASAKLTPGKSAVVADISEEWVTPLDGWMETLGGSVVRTAKDDFESEQRARDIEALKADIARLETEMAAAHGAHKAKLQAKIDIQKEKLRKKREQAAQRAEQIKKEGDAKIQALEKKGAKAHGDAKTAIDAHVTQIREAHQQTVTKLRNLAAEKLEKRAEQLEKKAEKLREKE